MKDDVGKGGGVGLALGRIKSTNIQPKKREKKKVGETLSVQNCDRIHFLGKIFWRCWTSMMAVSGIKVMPLALAPQPLLD